MTLLTTALLIASSVGYITYLASRPGIGFYTAPFLFCCILSLQLYSFAILGFLVAGLYFATGLGLILLVTTALQRRSFAVKPDQLIVSLPFIIFYLAISPDFKFSIWDEFSFWAASTKIIYETNALFNSSSPVFVKSYPPIQQLFQYFFAKLSFWSEKNVLYAQTFWVLSALLCVAGSLLRKPRSIWITFFISCSFLYFFNYSYSTIYSDPLLGACFAACTAMAIGVENNQRRGFAVFVGIAALVLIKEIAIVLAAVAGFIYLLSLSLRHTETDHKKLTAKSLLIAKSVLPGLIGIVLILKSWSWYVGEIQATRTETIHSMSDLFNPSLHHRIGVTFTEFTQRLSKLNYLNVSTAPGIPGPSIDIWVGLMVLVSALIIFFAPKTKRLQAALPLTVLFLGALGYAGVLFVSYLLVFTEYEGVRLASFERYLSSYMLAWLLIVFAMTAKSITSVFPRKYVFIQLPLAILIALVVPKDFYWHLNEISTDKSKLDMRLSVEALAHQLKPHIKQGQKAYFVAQHSNGEERIMFYYAMLPHTSSMGWCWSLGKKYDSGDVWTCEKRLPELLDGYDYLALYRSDKQFMDQEAELFDLTNDEQASGIYEIIRGKDHIKFKKIE